jgi:hypothetical protein
MANDYTRDVFDGDTSLKNFAKKVVRDLGAYAHMRDDAEDAPLRAYDDSVLAYYRAMLTEAQTERDAFLSLSKTEQQAAYEADIQRLRNLYQEASSKAVEASERYSAMLAKTAAWSVPAELDRLKEKMVEYLQQSIRFDCNPPRPVKEPTFDAWRADKVKTLEGRVNSRQDMVAGEERVIEELSGWHQMFMSALNTTE